VENKEEVVKLFEDIKDKWGAVDFVVHAKAYSDK
jgi:enoyl-[acyl-carrier-protein] reductase (NADH)